jgi:hypothetical protein
MKDFCLPNYKDGSIVNLMSSIIKARGGKSQYGSLKLLSPAELKDKKNVILLVIDGLGNNYLMKKKNSVLYKNIRGKMSSVFLPTTACAITTYLTGVAPQQHAHTGWFMNLKEVGGIVAVLRFMLRLGGPVISEFGFNVKDIIDVKPIQSKMKYKTITINPKKILNTDFMNLMGQKAINLKYNSEDIDNLFKKIKKAVKYSNKKKYIYSYWSGYDASAHDTGVFSKKTEKHFKEMDKKLGKFFKSLKGTNTTLIITADHGFVDAPVSKIVWIKNHPVFEKCLSAPLCGEARTPFCYVHSSKVKEFENYVRKKMNKYCYILKTKDIINKNYLGLFKPHKKLLNRLGDYALVCKKNYRIKDHLSRKSKKKEFVAHHGGLSEDEMYVPLIVMDF